VDTTSEITLGRVSDTRATSQSVRYRERLRVPWWWWLPGLGLAGLIALEVNQGVPALPNWVPFAVLLPVAAVVLLWFGKTEVRVVAANVRSKEGSADVRSKEGSADVRSKEGSADVRSKEGSGAGETELWVGSAHLPVSVIARSAEVPKSAKSAALGRQLDPAAFVVHRAWVGPMVLLILDDPDDPTPYWLVSCRHPERVLAALCG
jgi:hypothetical protein